jgi:peroxiredoxin
MIELEALQEVDSGVRALGGRILAISPQLEKYARSVHRKLNLTFDILTDLHFTTAEQFGLVFGLPDYLRELYVSFGTRLDVFHDESEYRLPMSARYIIDSSSIIRAADVNADYTIRPEPSDTLRLLRELRPLTPPLHKVQS